MKINLSKPEISRSHQIIVQAKKIQFGNTASLSLWSTNYNLLDIFKLAKLILCDKPEKYINKGEDFILFPSKKELKTTHIIQVKSFLNSDYKKFKQDSFSFGTKEENKDSEKIRDCIQKYLCGEEDISKDDYNKLNIGSYNTDGIKNKIGGKKNGRQR